MPLISPYLQPLALSDALNKFKYNNINRFKAKKTETGSVTPVRLTYSPAQTFKYQRKRQRNVMWSS